MGAGDGNHTRRPQPARTGWAGRAGDSGETADSRRTVGTVGRTVPRALALRSLACSLELPDRIAAGTQRPFLFHVKNRLPLGIALELPSSRVWGWEVDGVAEAGVGGFDPPAAPATLAFGPRERRTFTGRWDGQFRETEGERERWRPAVGAHELTAYLAVESWQARGTFASGSVYVTE